MNMAAIRSALEQFMQLRRENRIYGITGVDSLYVDKAFEQAEAALKDTGEVDDPKDGEWYWLMSNEHPEYAEVVQIEGKFVITCGSEVGYEVASYKNTHKFLEIPKPSVA